jgi:hypothetical protein
MDRGNTPISVFLDLSKAFDCIDHTILIRKLNHYGIRGASLELLRSYLTRRMQFTQFDQVKSDLQPLQIGVPQGSNLGPFLFLIYLNDLSSCSDLFKIVNYADDSTLLSTLNSFSFDEGAINRELDRAQKWFNANRLSVNPVKTKMMIFHPPNKQVVAPNLLMNNTPLEIVDNFVYLGITINKNLSWKPHTQKNCFQDLQD